MQEKKRLDVAVSRSGYTRWAPGKSKAARKVRDIIAGPAKEVNKLKDLLGVSSAPRETRPRDVLDEITPELLAPRRDFFRDLRRSKGLEPWGRSDFPSRFFLLSLFACFMHRIFELTDHICRAALHPFS